MDASKLSVLIERAIVMRFVAIATWVTAVMTTAGCMPSFAQEADESYLTHVHYTVRVQEDHPLSGFAEKDHACGATITLQADKLPLNVPGVDVDRAYELDAKGRIKTEWALPVEATPVAIAGSHLLIHQFEQPEEEYVFVTPEGGIGIPLGGPPEIQAPNDNDEHENRVECPVLSEQWDMCSRLVDVATGAVRTIAHHFHCTSRDL